MIQARTTIPAVLDYLYEGLQTPLGGYGVMVTDGMPDAHQANVPDIFCVGFSGIPGEPAINSNTRTTEQLSRSPDQESYDILCVASSWHGNNTETKSLRDTAYGIVDVVNEFLMKDHTLGGLVMRARISDDQYAQEQTSKGAVVTVRFSIQIVAVTRA